MGLSLDQYVPKNQKYTGEQYSSVLLFLICLVYLVTSKILSSFIKTNSRDQSFKNVEFFSMWWRLHERHRQLPQVSHNHHLDLQVVQCIHLVIYSASGGTGDSKGKRKQNVVSVQISEAAPEEGFSVEGDGGGGQSPWRRRLLSPPTPSKMTRVSLRSFSG